MSEQTPFMFYVGLFCAIVLAAWFLTEISFKIWPEEEVIDCVPTGQSPKPIFEKSAALEN